MKRETYEHLQRERNFLPDQLLLQVDFAENFVFNVHQNEIQAQHWSSKMATLFTSMARHLDKHAWDDIDGHIAVGDHLSVRTPIEDGRQDKSRVGQRVSDRVNLEGGHTI